MAMDNEVKEAIKSVNNDFSQTDELAIKLISWLDELSDGKTTIQNKDEVKKHIENILHSVDYSFKAKITGIDKVLKKMNLT